jgi:hypothetical protein
VSSSTADDLAIDSERRRVDLIADAMAIASEQRQVDLILASRHFNKSPLLSAFLAYVFRRAMQEGVSRISEQEIGVNVFGRQEGYNCKEDNIVRNYARQLRNRLDEYYATDGREEELRIDIPKGGYVPLFRLHRDALQEEKTQQSVAPNDKQEEPAGRSSVRIPGLKQFSILAAGLIVCSVLVYVFTVFSHEDRKIPPEKISETHLLWDQLFVPNKNTIVVPADTAFVMLQEFEKKRYSLVDYTTWPSVEQPTPRFPANLKSREYTSVIDMQTAARLEQLPEVNPGRFLIRPAHSLTIEALRDENVVFLGSVYSDPWIEIFQKNLNFQFVYSPEQNRSWIENRSPAAGEAARYTNDWSGFSEKAYAVLAFIPNLNKTGHILLIQGLDGAGTEAAVNMLFRDGALNDVLNKVRHPDGTLGSFEVLLESTSLDSHATSTRILAMRTPN